MISGTNAKALWTGQTQHAGARTGTGSPAGPQPQKMGTRDDSQEASVETGLGNMVRQNCNHMGHSLAALWVQWVSSLTQGSTHCLIPGQLGVVM